MSQTRARIKTVIDYDEYINATGVCCETDGTKTEKTFSECQSSFGAWTPNVDIDTHVCANPSVLGHCCSCKYASSSWADPAAPGSDGGPFGILGKSDGIRSGVSQCECDYIGGNWTPVEPSTPQLRRSLCYTANGVEGRTDVRFPFACCHCETETGGGTTQVCTNVCDALECAELNRTDVPDCGSIFVTGSICNYDTLNGQDPFLCGNIVYGCTDPAAENYDPSATIDDGSCGGAAGPAACTEDPLGPECRAHCESDPNTPVPFICCQYHSDTVGCNDAGGGPGSGGDGNGGGPGGPIGDPPCLVDPEGPICQQICEDAESGYYDPCICDQYHPGSAGAAGCGAFTSRFAYNFPNPDEGDDPFRQLGPTRAADTLVSDEKIYKDYGFDIQRTKKRFEEESACCVIGGCVRATRLSCERQNGFFIDPDASGPVECQSNPCPKKSSFSNKGIPIPKTIQENELPEIGTIFAGGVYMGIFNPGISKIKVNLETGETEDARTSEKTGIGGDGKWALIMCLSDLGDEFSLNDILYQHTTAVESIDKMETSSFDGLLNTFGGEKMPAPQVSLFKQIRDYNRFSFRDWYLPSIQELGFAIHAQKEIDFLTGYKSRYSMNKRKLSSYRPSNLKNPFDTDLLFPYLSSTKDTKPSNTQFGDYPAANLVFSAFAVPTGEKNKEKDGLTVLTGLDNKFKIRLFRRIKIG